jgi:hypothetical protein
MQGKHGNILLDQENYKDQYKAKKSKVHTQSMNNANIESKVWE